MSAKLTRLKHSSSNPILLATTWTTFKIYYLYRVLLSVLLVALGYVDFQASNSRLMPLFYQIVSSGYLFFTLTTFFILIQIRLEGQLVKFTIVASDILVITMLVHASGGLTSDLAILLVVAVAAGGILVAGRPGILLAAIATIGVLFEQFFFMLMTESTAYFTNTGILGITFFAVSLLSQKLAKQLGESEALASHYEANLAEWKELSLIIIQRMRTGIIVLSNSGKIQLFNSTCSKVLQIPNNFDDNLTLKDVAPKLYDEFIAWQNNHDKQPSKLRIFESGPSIRCDFTELVERHKDSRILGFIEDTTTLAQQAQQIKLASLATLTAGIAHEIRNPLGAISHAAQLLLESEALKKEDLQLANIIQQHSVRMNNIIENVLYLSRRKKPTPSIFNLNERIQAYIEAFKISHKKPCNIKLISLQDNIMAHIDQGQLEQVLTNLIENGLRYSLKETGEANLEITLGYSGEFPILQVRDFGPGISEELANQLFEPFFTTEPQGTGLGLYLARELCEINHAQLGLKTCEGSGCCFQITLPHPKKRLQDKEMST